MAKLISLLILVDHSIYIGEERVDLKAGSVHDLEPNQAKELVKSGIADDNSANVAYHAGDTERYEALLSKAKSGGKSAKTDAADEKAKADALQAAQDKAKADADALIAQAEELRVKAQAAVGADQEALTAQAEELSAQAADILQQAGITE